MAVVSIKVYNGPECRPPWNHGPWPAVRCYQAKAVRDQAQDHVDAEPQSQSYRPGLLGLLVISFDTSCFYICVRLATQNRHSFQSPCAFQNGQYRSMQSFFHSLGMLDSPFPFHWISPPVGICTKTPNWSSIVKPEPEQPQSLSFATWKVM